jgi:regulatory protein
MSPADRAPGVARVSRAERRAAKAEIDDPGLVLEAALRFLEARARSVAEVRRRLVSAGYRPDLVEGAVGRLTDLGVLDDGQFARAWVESRDRARPRGERALANELRIKGVDRETVAAVLEARRDTAMDAVDPAEDASPSSADESAAARLIERNARSLARVADPRARRQRAYALLARNGFSPDVCSRVAAQAVSDDEDDPG